MKNLCAGMMLLLQIGIWVTANADEPTAEFRIEKSSIYPQMIDEPLPKDKSVVDENPPWLHVRLPLVSATEEKGPKQEIRKLTEQRLGHRLYFFKLSQDQGFKVGVTESGPKRWAFYNTYKVLAKGTWYWTYGVGMDSNPSAVEWSGKVLSFKITGNERIVDVPPPSALFEGLRNTPKPHIVVQKNQIGKLVPENRLDLKKDLLDYLEKTYNNRLDMKIILDESTYPSDMPAEGKFRYFQYLGYKEHNRRIKQVYTLLRGYLLTGDEKYKKAALEDFWNLDQEYRTTLMRYPARPGYPDDFSFEHHVKTMFFLLDVFESDLTPEQKNYIIEYTFKAKREDGYLNFRKQLEFSEHAVYKAHLWQSEVQNLFLAGIALAPYKEEAKTMLEYAYELILYRNPAGGRNDGGWHEGNGYFGANIRHLTQVPIIIKNLTGYDQFTHPWYQNLAKFDAYAKAPGNPSIAFADSPSLGIGNDHSTLIEALAYTHPENPWNLWRMKSTRPLVDSNFAESIFEDESAWELLTIWNQYPKPDYMNVAPPEEKAAVFRDIGYAAMHTDMLNASDNLLLNFRSCPFGQINHAHPAQNAFNIAYGGKPLFWHTGYYHGNDEHKSQSFKHSRAHNTILPNGAGQSMSVKGYGWVPRFATGQRISYVLGDASNAYTESAEGNPQVTRFRRHVAMLRPNYIVIYDELEAKKPIPWTFRLNNHTTFTKLSDDVILSESDSAYATVTFFNKDPLETTVTDQFVVQPVDTRGLRRIKTGSSDFPNQWHSSTTSKDNLSATRFLTIIEVSPKAKGGAAAKPLTGDDNGGMLAVKMGDYELLAQLDADKPSFLQVRDKNQTCGLVTGQAAHTLELGNEKYTAKLQGSTLLFEEHAGKHIFVEVADQLPDAMVYGNLY